MARGSKGSLTRTISKNIMLTSASDATMITTKTLNILNGSKGFGIPAITAPMVISTLPAMTAFTVPERLNPEINSNFVIGVTR